MTVLKWSCCVGRSIIWTKLITCRHRQQYYRFNHLPSSSLQHRIFPGLISRWIIFWFLRYSNAVTVKKNTTHVMKFKSVQSCWGIVIFINHIYNIYITETLISIFSWMYKYLAEVWISSIGVDIFLKVSYYCSNILLIICQTSKHCQDIITFPNYHQHHLHQHHHHLTSITADITHKYDICACKYGSDSCLPTAQGRY